MDLHQAHALLRARRSTKPVDLRPDPIPVELLRQLLDAARWAPTHGQREPWRFGVFHTEPGRAELAEFLAAEYGRITPAGEFREEKLAKLRATPLSAAAVITIGVEPDPHGRIPLWEDQAAVACAVQNLHLAASAAGLGGYWSSPPAACGLAIAAFSGWPEESGVLGLGLFYLGWQRPDAPQPRRGRREIEAIATWR